MKHLILYTTQGCHLCEIALQLIQRTLARENFRLEEVEISNSERLVDDYGIRIPVLADPESRAELGWPFDAQQLLNYVDQLPLTDVSPAAGAERG
jgi:glutaredoxin